MRKLSVHLSVKNKMTRQDRFLAIPFFVSGFAALIYQISWQRLLFVAFGVDIESITIIVSTFMFGLGIGALAGGWLSDRFPDFSIKLFAAAEFLIGFFGIISPDLIHLIGKITIEQSNLIIALANFTLLLVPTTLMGATLPILVAYLARTNGNVGVSIGGLYFINTLGAAIGSISVGFLLFFYFNVDTVIYMAAALNITVSLGIMLLARRFQ